MEEKILTHDIAVKLVKEYLRDNQSFKVGNIRKYFRRKGYNTYRSKYNNNTKIVTIDNAKFSRVFATLREKNMIHKISAKVWVVK